MEIDIFNIKLNSWVLCCLFIIVGVIIYLYYTKGPNTNGCNEIDRLVLNETNRIHDLFLLDEDDLFCLHDKNIFPLKWKDEPENYDGENKCIICTEKQAIIVATPCGHLATCNKCCRDYNKDQCIICRQKVIQYTRIYKIQ